ncbi:MAG: AraC family transcriptional regulator [Planctomycetota bacterium]|jgi:AraC-like DNA-binding protein/quercetin dioxygenase-like cupin family protein|nr:AraC family transcriptional regulator [Planctomycetota bacterium]
MEPRRYLWQHQHAPSPHLAAARHHARSGNEPRWHNHDYYELFWIESGSGLHLQPSGNEALSPGQGRCIRPHDVHTFLAKDEGMEWMNVAIAADTMRALHQRYRHDCAHWPWDGDQPFAFQLSSQQMQQLSLSAEAVPGVEQNRLDVDWFMLGFLRMLNTTSDNPSAIPAWLRDAIHDLSHNAEALQDGIPALVARCGVSPRHCNRALQQHYRCSAGDLIRQLRIEHAARLLQFSRHSIIHIALDAGFEHLGTFYRCFKQRYGLTPRQFRARGEVG